VDLAQRRLQAADPFAIEVAEPGVMLAITYLVLCCGRTYVTRLGVALGDTGHLRSLDAT
jgi:hypothetical protein